MAENNQLSDETKNNSTDTSSTDASSAVIGNHENAVAPHKISNHDKLVQTMVMVDGEWINVNDTNDQANMKEDMHKVNKKVVEAQKGIVEAKNTADSAVKYADSAISASKVNSDAIVAQREAISEAKSTMDSAAASIRADVAKVQSEVNTAKTANETEVKSIRDDLKMANSSIATVKDHLGNVSSELDTYAKSAATQGHDITIIQQKQGQFEVDYAGTKGDVNQLKANIKGLSENLKNSEGDVNSLQVTAKKLQSSMSDAEGNISNLQATAKSYDKIFEDHLGRISKVEQTASELTNEFSDQQGHLNRVEQTAQGTQQTVANQQGQINNIKTDAAGMHQTITGQGNQIANINVTLGGLSTKYEDVSGDLSKLKGSNQWKIVTGAFDANQYTQTARIFYQDTQAKNTPDSGWFYLMVEAPEANRITQNLIKDNSNDSWSRFYSGEWSSWTRGITQLDIDSLSNKITTNSTAIDQTNKHISLKADQTEVDKIKNTASQNSSRLDVMDNAIKSKVTSTDVNNIINGKGYATTSTVQSLITQKAGTINESIANLTSKVNSNVTQVQSLTASIDGLQSTVASKADRSQITQLSNVIQSKVSSTDFNNLRKAVDLQTLESADANNLKTNGHYFVHNLANNPVGGWVYVDVTGNGNDRIRQDVYQDSGNKHKYRRWFGNSWTNWSEGATESEITQLRDDINLRVKKGDLLSQINITADNTLIQSGKIYLDAKSVVFGKDSEAFIPAALITNLTADQITTGTLKSIQIDNGNGTFHVDPEGNVTANRITLRHGQFLQGTIAGSTIYALNNDGVQDPKLAPKSDWYKITPNMIRWFNHYDQSVGQIGVGQGMIGDSEFTGAPGLTISDSAKILLGTAQRILVNGDEIGNLETTGLDWISRTNLEIKPDSLQVNLDPNYGTKYDGKGAEFAIQKNNKIGAYFGSGDNGDKLSITAAGITFNTALFSVCGEVHIPDHGLTVKALHVTNWLGVDGYKNSIVRTSQGTVAINAYETAEYYFGDIGEDQTNSDGKVWVSIDYLFGQTVNTSVPYQVFVTPYSSAHVWVSKRLKNRFLVESDKPSASFAWEIKAKRKGYEHTRLKNVDNMMEKPAGVK